MTEPALRLLSLGAGVQSTALALLAADGRLDPLDGAIFADTGWEPAGVYAHLDRLEERLTAAGIPVYRVSQGNLREDAIDPTHRFASVPYFVRNPPFVVPLWGPCPADGCGWAELVRQGVEVDDADQLVERPADCERCENAGRAILADRPATLAEREGMGRRQCTAEYKLAPIMRKIRELLGAPGPDYKRVPRGPFAEQWIGFSTDEIGRVNDGRGVLYERKRYPLLELGWSRTDCARYLRDVGWGSTTKSACIGCPYHGNAQWRELRDERPDEWADAVAFDAAIRKGGARGLPLDGEAFLHRSRVPLDQAPIDRVTRRELAERQGDLLSLLPLELAEKGDPDGCSPYGCRSGDVVELEPAA